MARGGKRPGAGRPKGVLSEATKLRQAVAAKALGEGITPLEVMLAAMREALGPDGKNFVAAHPFAKEAAPYMHPKLANTEVKMEADVRSTVEAEPLSPEKWEAQHGVGAAPH